MDTDTLFNAISGLFMFFAAVVPCYYVAKVPNRTLRVASLLLAAFLIAHGTYHLVSIASMELKDLADNLIEPLSWLLLVMFAAFYTKRIG